MADLQQRLNQVEEIIKKPAFRENKGLSNEVGYYIFDYPADQELIVRERVKKIIKKHEKGTYGFKLVVFDLYELIISILIEKNFLNKCCDFEKTKGFEYITRSIESAFRFTGEKNLLVEHVQNNTPDNSVVFLTGVGKCYPILRSHNILNNLHQAMDKVPVVMFYPGKYDKQELILFSELKDQNYYRAFKLVD